MKAGKFKEGTQDLVELRTGPLYTPAALNTLVSRSRTSREGIAKRLGVSKFTFYNWSMEYGVNGHRDMPHKMWAKFLNLEAIKPLWSKDDE
jgi:hypothetical protein